MSVGPIKDEKATEYKHVLVEKWYEKECLDVFGLEYVELLSPTDMNYYDSPSNSAQ